MNIFLSSYRQGDRISARSVKRNFTTGFTLIEMIVATSIFIIAMLLIVGALISLQNASRKARTIRVATDNVSAAVDSISRNLRMGSSFHCGCTGALDVPQNCPMTDTAGGGGDTCLAFEGQLGDSGTVNDQFVYRLFGGRIERSTDGGATYLPLTAPEINMSKLRFYVSGTETNLNQPYVTMVVQGTASSTKTTSTSFDIQTTIAERTPNFAP